MVDFTKSIRINLNLNQNELQDVVIQSLATAPAAKKVGYIYFDSTKNKFGVCIDATIGAQKWAYMSSVEEVNDAINNLNEDIKDNLSKLDKQKQDNLTLDNTLAFAEDENKTLGVQTANLTIATAGAAGVVKSGDKIAVAEDGTMNLVDGTVAFGKLADGAVQKESISAAEAASDEKLVTEKAVRAGLDAVASAAETSTQIDEITIVRGEDKKLKVAEGSEDKGLETKHFKTGVIVSEITASGDETKLASDKAVRVAINTAIANVYKIKGSVNTYAELPELPEVGDVYNISTADPEHNIKAGDNVVWVGAVEGGEEAHWDVLSGVVDLSAYSTTDQINAKLAEKQHKLESSDTITLVPGEGDAADKLNVVTAALDKATTEAVGVVELATAEEVKAGEDSTRAVTPVGAKALVEQDIEAFRTATVELEGKTIDAGKNTISGLSAANIADASLSLGASETKADAKLLSLAKANELISAAAPGVDGKTLELFDNTAAGGSDHDIRVKDSGLTVAKMDVDAVSKIVAVTAEASDKKLVTEKAVRDLHDGIPAETMTLTNKTFVANGDGNVLSNVKVDNFAEGVIVKAKGEGTTGGIAADVTAADDAKLATEKAIAEALAAIRASATVVKSVPLNFQPDSTEATESATATVTLNSLGVDATHKVSIAKMLDGEKNEVEGLITYNQENGSVVFQINCDSAPTGWTALIVC